MALGYVDVDAVQCDDSTKGLDYSARTHGGPSLHRTPFDMDRDVKQANEKS